jgi:DNA-binding CsgD family transcriptional regulator
LEKSAYDTSRRNELAQNIQIVRKAIDMRQELAWDDFAALCRQMDKRFHGLASRLQELGLNEQDVRICILVLIGLSHKEIADMLNCSPKSIGKQKDLTAHKLGVSGGQLQDKLQKTAIL